jgi:hypothetical protein
MNELPLSVRAHVRRLSRRLAIGLFLDIWPAWAVGGFLAAGALVVIARLFVAPAAPYLAWFWVTPLVAALPALVVCLRRAYRPAQVIALADSLAGGDGLLLALAERPDAAWSASDVLDRIARHPLPSLRPWRQLRLLPAAMAFLAAAFLVPQRVVADASHAALADQVVAGAVSSVAAMKKDQLITREEEKKLDQEIQQIRLGAKGRVDAGSWEAADAMQERMAANLAAKQDAVKWAQESMSRLAAAAAQGGTNASNGTASSAAADAAELTKALQRLAESGLLNGAPSELAALAAGRGLPADPQSLARLQAMLGKFLGDKAGRLAEAASIAKGGRFDPSEFATGASEGAHTGQPGRGGVDRGRGDADLTFGPETKRFDRFKAQALPPGSVRSPDDWAPIAELPGAPATAAVTGASAAARNYTAGAGQEAWRRTLAPRHQSAVKKYFDASR